MTSQFTQAAKNLLRTIGCPSCAEENREAVQQFLFRFTKHIIGEIVPSDLEQSSTMKSITQIAQEIGDMPEENMPEENPLTSTLAQLIDLLTWEDGWNSYDALAPNPENVTRATTWIIELFQRLVATQQPWIEPIITGGGGGEVVIHWYHRRRDITVYIDVEEKYVYYIMHQGKGITARLDDGEIEDVDDMQQLWQWLLEAPQETEASSDSIP